MESNIDQIVRELVDGLDLDFEYVKEKLLWFQAANQISLIELRELCWEDSDFIFNEIM